MSANELDIFDSLKGAISAIVEAFRAHPLDFLSERDIQALLFAELRKRTLEFRYPYDAHGENARFDFKQPFESHPVTAEYFLYERGQARFDVAILSAKQDLKASIWRQPCRVGIEIKLWQPGYGAPSYNADVEKLQKYQEYLRDKFKEEDRKFTGIAMVFVHPNIERALVPKHLTSLEESSSVVYPEDGVALYWIEAPSTPSPSAGGPVLRM